MGRRSQSMNDKYWKDKDDFDEKYFNNDLSIEDIIKTEKTDCLSVLIDLKGTKSFLNNNEQSYIKKMNEFYNIVESFFSHRATNFGDFLAITFSDSFYIEIYNPENPKRKSYRSSRRTDLGYELELLLGEIINLAHLIDSSGFKARIFCSIGYTYRRVFQNTFAIPVQENKFLKPGLIHLFGFGNCMMRVFEAERSHFKGLFFIDEKLFERIIIQMNNYGSYSIKSSGAKFICIINDKSRNFWSYLGKIDSHGMKLEKLYALAKKKYSDLYKKNKKRFNFIWKKYVEDYKDRIKKQELDE